MGRSSTLPLTEQRPSESSKTPINRSATTGYPSDAGGTSSHPVKVPSRHHDAKQKATTARSAALHRPVAPTRHTSVQTRYVDMLLSQDTIPRLHNILGSFFTWILLAGFIIFPGTFTSLQQLDSDPTIQNNQAASAILQSVKNLPLLVIAGVCCAIGAGGMLWLWWVWRDNYIWLLNRIFLPGCLNSFAGLISTLINVYTQQNGAWSITAEVTAIVTGVCMVITGVLFGLYNFWALEMVKRNHGREMETVTREPETFGEKVERVVHEPALEPGSVV